MIPHTDILYFNELQCQIKIVQLRLSNNTLMIKDRC